MFKVCITTFLILAIMSFNSAASWLSQTSDVNSYRIYLKNGNFYVSKAKINYRYTAAKRQYWIPYYEMFLIQQCFDS